MKKNKFGFIGHYLNNEHMLKLINSRMSALNQVSQVYSDALIKEMKPYQLIEVPEIVSETGVVVGGEIIVCPFLPRHVLSWGEDFVLERVFDAIKFADELGVEFLSLGGFTSIIGNEGEVLSRRTAMNLTSGNSYTAALVISGVRHAVNTMELPMKKLVVSVIGATGDIGSACCAMLSQEVGELRLVARNNQKLSVLALDLEVNSPAKIVVYKRVSEAIKDADIIITATSALTTILNSEDIKSGAIVCDVALPHNVGIDLVRSRNDVLVFEGGLAALPPNNETKWCSDARISSDGETVFGCLAEAIILSMENRRDNFSIGRGLITVDKLEEIYALGIKHGFGLPQFRYGDVYFEEDFIRRIGKKRDRERACITKDWF